MFTDSLWVRWSKIILRKLFWLWEKIHKILNKKNKIKWPVEAFILFDKYLGIGDLLMISPLIKAVSESNFVKCCYIVTEWPEVFDCNVKHINKKEFSKRLEETKREQLVIISPTYNSRHALYLLSRNNLIGYFSSNKLYSNFTSIKFVYESKNAHYNTRVIPLIKYFDDEFQDIGFNDYPPIKKIKTKYFPDEKYIVISPYLRTKTRKWPADNYLGLISMLSTTYSTYKIVLLGGGSSDEMYYNQRFELNKRVINLTGKTGLDEAISIIFRCTMFIGNDSGLAHFSYFSKCCSIVLFGAVSPDERLPVGGTNNHPIYSSSSCKYFPCHDTIERPSCKNKIKYICISSISLDNVKNRIKKYMK